MVNIEQLKFLLPEEARLIDEQFGSPVYIYDLATIKKNYNYLAEMPAAFDKTIRYSVKANPNGVLLNVFDRLGSHFDVSSVYEAMRCIAAGIEPQKILLTSQESANGWIDLCKQGVIFDAGSLNQLRSYGENFPNSDVAVRINPGFGSGLVKKTNTGGEYSSFGIWIGDLDKVESICQQYHLNLNRLHIHIGSGHEGLLLRDSVKIGLEICRRFTTIKFLNLGGGYRAKTLLSDPEYNHEETFKYIQQLFEEFAIETKRKLSLEIEPGTFLVALAGSLLSKIVDIVSTSEDVTFLKLNTGLTELIRPSYYHVLHPLVVVGQNGQLSELTKKYYVSGHCCESSDVLTFKFGDSDELAPLELSEAQLNDYLVIERCGAYCSSMSLKNFNSYPEAAEVLRLGYGEYKLIRKRQDIADITRNEIKFNIEELV